MILRDTVDHVEQSAAYTSWKQKYPSTFLSRIFITYDNNLQRELQVSYIHPENNTVSTFSIHGEHIVLSSERQPLVQQQIRSIKELPIDQITLSPEQARSAAQERDTGVDHFTRFILLLENNPEPMWRITAFSDTFTILHLSLQAETGKIVEEKLTNVMAFRQGRGQ
jgi:hypothetical protein